MASIIPRPARMTISAGQFQISDKTRIVVDPEPEIRRMGELFAEYVQASCGIDCIVMPVSGGSSPENDIRISRNRPGRNEESYTLEVLRSVVRLTGESDEGLFRGVQTLRQLVTNSPKVASSEFVIPCVAIDDSPRFRHRGMLLDCGRHFMTKEFVKRYIDLLAYHKMNVLHWHLTEDQGWRIEIKKYPELTRVGAWRKAMRDSEQPRDSRGRYGGFYTQDDIREIVAYAQARYITIIPEIEMPGHSLAALAA